MNSSMLFSITSLIFIGILAIIFFTKDKVKSNELSLFSKQIVFTIISLIVEIIMTIELIFNKSINSFFMKLFNVCIFTWFWQFFLYVYLTTTNKVKSEYKTKILYKLYVTFYIVITLLLFVLPIYLNEVNNAQYSYGASVNLLYVVSGGILGFTVICCLVNYKNIMQKKCIPIIAFSILMIIVAILQNINPSLLISNLTFSIVIFLMYHTIENPDVKMLEELYKNSTLLEQTVMEKSNFLFEMTEEVKSPLNNIKNVCNNLVNAEDKSELKKGIKEIKNYISYLDFVVSDVLDINKLTADKIKIYDSKYEISKVFNEIVLKVKNNLSDKQNFKYSIADNIPVLYGDSIKIKQILYSIISSLTSKGTNSFTEFNIDNIIRYDACRLIITIKNSVSDIDLKEINEILATTADFNEYELKALEKNQIDLKLCQKMLKLLGGNLIIKSKKEIGTEIIIVLDQKIYLEKKTEIVNYLPSFKKNILLVCQDKEMTKKIKNICQNSDINLINYMNGYDAIEKLKNKNSFDCIIVDDDMKIISGYSFMKELEKLKIKKMPAIILLSKEKESIKDKYLKDGFDDYLLTDKFNEEIKRILNKY